METDLGLKMKQLLDSMSQEEFDQQWETVLSYGFVGPSVDDMISTFHSTFTAEYIFDSNQSIDLLAVGTNRFTLAA